MAAVLPNGRESLGEQPRRREDASSTAHVEEGLEAALPMLRSHGWKERTGQLWGYGEMICQILQGWNSTPTLNVMED